MSTFDDPSPSKAERALSAAHARRDLRHLREARAGYWRASIVSTFFVVVLIANLTIGAVVVVGALRKEPDTASIAIGRAKIPMLDGVFCRHVLFNNKTAETKEDKVSRCDDQDDRRPILRPKSTFSWGG